MEVVLMKKNTKRILTLVMAVLMLTALCTAAFAAQPDQQQSNITVYVKLQTATSPTGTYSYVNQMQNVVDITGITATDTSVVVNYGNNYSITYLAVSVPVTGNSVTVKDVVNALPLADILDCDDCGTYGCDHSNGSCECGSSCDCTWVEASDYYTGNPVSALNSLDYNNNSYTNNSTTTYNEDYTHGSYSGTSWEFFYAADNTTIPAYSYSYMDQVTVSSGYYIVLSFDTSSFTW